MQYKQTTRNDVMIMNTKTQRNEQIDAIENALNDVVTNANNDDASNDDATQTTRVRDTTRALRDAKIALRKNENERIVNVDDDHKIKIVKTSTQKLRIDHSLCDHENSKNARSKCRARVANMNKK